MPVETDSLIAHLVDEGVRLASAAGAAGWESPVPRTDWTVRDLVTHVGGVHRWAADVIRTGAADLTTPLGLAVGQGPPDEELLGWYREGHEALVAALREAPPDLEAGTFLPAPSPRNFWARRQAHETAIHRADADAACGVAAVFDPDFAQDGIAELLQGFAARQHGPELGDTLTLRCTDGPSWVVDLSGERVTAAPMPEVERGDVSGSSSDVYLWTWNRDSSALVDETLPAVEWWRDAVTVTWS